MRNHKKLEVYELSMQLVENVYRLTRSFPLEERFGLISQMQRAATSVPSNLAEGCARASDADTARFVNIAYSSCQELIVQLELSERLGFTKDVNIGVEAERVAKALYGFWKSFAEGRTPAGTRDPEPGPP